MKHILFLARVGAILFIIAEIMGVCWAINIIRQPEAQQVQHELLESLLGLPAK